MSSREIAELLFPNIRDTPDDIYRRYPPRNVRDGAIVTRFAPSPTGFIHLGSIYTSLVAQTLARQSSGIFLLRIEDTDQQRQIEGGLAEIIENLSNFGIEPDEGPYKSSPVIERGDYGPYQQSQRSNIYQVFAKQLVADGLAYPSFQSNAELADIRSKQEREHAKPGYYGPWAQDRQLTVADVQKYRQAGRRFVIRYQAAYPNNTQIRVSDAIRGVLEMPANDQDVVLLKSDGLATYHLAHVVDDSLMRINLVLRGDEWLSSLPVHVQLFAAMGFAVPVYAHIAPIGKIDGSSKRKLSKRKDPEAAVSYYHSRGYPTQAITEYLLNIGDLEFEAWRRGYPNAPLSDFHFRLDRMSSSIALFDLDKLQSVSKDVIGRYTPGEIYDELCEWASIYDVHFAKLLVANMAYSELVLGVGRLSPSPRKDIACWADVYTEYGFFYDEVFEELTSNGYLMPKVSYQAIAAVLNYLIEITPRSMNKTEWLSAIRNFGTKGGFAPNSKTYANAPGEFLGTFGDMMMACRISLANRHYTPDLHDMINLMGEDRAISRFTKAKNWCLQQLGTPL